jgi:hypothetical protein
MMIARILGANMALFFYLRFLISTSQGKKAFSRFNFNRFFILKCIFLSFLGEIIHTHNIDGVCGYLYRSYLLQRFLTLGYCSFPINRLGGESNDFNK